MAIFAGKVPTSPPEHHAPSASHVPLSRRVPFQSRLHNFDFSVLKTWGRHQVLRCLSVNRRGEIISGSHRSNLIDASTSLPQPIRQNGHHVSINDGTGSEDVRAIIRVQLHEAAVLTSTAKESKPAHEQEALRAPLPGATSPSIPVTIHSSNSPWNVNRPCNRTTRKVVIRKTPCSAASPPPTALEKNVQRRATRRRCENFEDWPKISIHLSREQIKEDIQILTGSRPSRHPRKRPRVVQRQLDQLYPGSSLTSISPNTYRMSD